MNRTRTATALGALLAASVVVSGASALAAPAKPAAGKTSKPSTVTATPSPTATVAPSTAATTTPTTTTTTTTVEPTAAPVKSAAAAAPVDTTTVPVQTVTTGATVGAEPTTAVTVTAATGATAALEQAATALLTRPVLVAPVVATITPSMGYITLDDSRDYALSFQAGALFTKEITLVGGHNVVLENTALTYAAPAGAPTTLFRGLYLKGQTGTMYVNGLRINGPLTEGIDLDQRAPGATVVLRNITIGKITGTYDTNHADLLQTWAGPDKLVVDGFSGVSDYQGMMLKPNDEWTGPVPSFFSLRNITIDVTTGYYALWTVAGRTFPITTTNVTVKPNPAKPSRDMWLWPKPSTGDATWTSVLGLF